MKKQCQQCNQGFRLTTQDEEFYNRIKVPQPTLCSNCRWQRRLVVRNERSLYQDKCDLCNKNIISMYSPDKPFKVYCYDCFHSDKWDRKQYAQEFDFTKPFFEQFKELQLKVPRIHGFAVNNDNSEYTNGSAYNKNCYMIFVSDHNENCMYSYSIFNCHSVMDCINSYDCELGYELDGCTNCFGSKYLTDCANCNESELCLDCKGCANCFGCVGLRNKEYHIFNKPVSPEEYKKIVRTSRDLSEQKFNQLKKQHSFLYMHGIKNENSTGDYINRCKDAHNCYDSHDLENCKNIINGNKCKDTYDGYMIGDNTELTYETVGSLNCYDCQFNFFIINATNVEYSDSCMSSKNLFGCVGLKKEEFCILNKQYTEEEFYKMKERIIEHMKQNGEYGEFFPVKNNPFAFNETAAHEYYPVAKDEAKSRGWQWLSSAKASESKKDLPTCIKCSKNYNFSKQEQKFYQEQNISKPKKCFNCRHEARLKNRNPRKLYKRKCNECSTDIKTTFSDEKPEIILCRKCYNNKVN